MRHTSNNKTTTSVGIVKVSECIEKIKKSLQSIQERSQSQSEQNEGLKENQIYQFSVEIADELLRILNEDADWSDMTIDKLKTDSNNLIFVEMLSVWKEDSLKIGGYQGLLRNKLFTKYENKGPRNQYRQRKTEQNKRFDNQNPQKKLTKKDVEPMIEQKQAELSYVSGIYDLIQGLEIQNSSNGNHQNNKTDRLELIENEIKILEDLKLIKKPLKKSDT